MPAFHEFAGTDDLLICFLTGYRREVIEKWLGRLVTCRELERNPALIDDMERDVREAERLARPAYAWGNF